MKRSLGDNRILIFDGEEKVMDSNHFNDTYHVDGVIRFHPEDFVRISGKLMHFNLEMSGHKKGKVYALMKILRAGFFDGSHEELPLLDIHFILARCIGSQEHVSYEELSQIDLSLSFPNMRTVEGVQKAILKRYNRSVPHIQDKLNLGVGITYLEKIK